MSKHRKQPTSLNVLKETLDTLEVSRDIKLRIGETIEGSGKSVPLLFCNGKGNKVLRTSLN